MTEATGEPLRLAFLLVPQFPLLPFSAAIEPLRGANRLSDRAVYAWELTSIDGKPVVRLLFDFGWVTVPAYFVAPEPAIAYDAGCTALQPIHRPARR